MFSSTRYVENVTKKQKFFKNEEFQKALKIFNTEAKLTEIKYSTKPVIFEFDGKTFRTFTTGEKENSPSKALPNPDLVLDNFTTSYTGNDGSVYPVMFTIKVNGDDFGVVSKELLLQAFKFPPSARIADALEPLEKKIANLPEKEQEMKRKLSEILTLMSQSDNTINLRIFVISNLSAGQAADLGRNFPITNFDPNFFRLWDSSRRISAGFVAFSPQFSDPTNPAQEILLEACKSSESLLELQKGPNPWTAQALKRGTVEIDSSVNLLGEILVELGRCILGGVSLLEMVPEEDWEWFGLTKEFKNFKESSLVW